MAAIQESAVMYSALCYLWPPIASVTIFSLKAACFFLIQESVLIQTKSVHPQPSLQQRFTKTLSLMLFTLTSALNISPRAVNPESCS